MSTPLANVILRGVRASQPAASSVCAGSLYYVSDEGVTERSNSVTWDDYTDLALLSVTLVVPIQEYGITGSPISPTTGTVTIFKLPVFANGSTSGSASLDFNNGITQSLVLIGDATLSFLNPVAGNYYTLLVKQDSAGGHLITWPSAVKWSGGGITLTTTGLQTDVLTLVYDGTLYYQVSASFDC